jgi:hypothetical protein
MVIRNKESRCCTNVSSRKMSEFHFQLGGHPNINMDLTTLMIQSAILRTTKQQNWYWSPFQYSSWFGIQPNSFPMPHNTDIQTERKELEICWCKPVQSNLSTLILPLQFVAQIGFSEENMWLANSSPSIYSIRYILLLRRN